MNSEFKKILMDTVRKSLPSLYKHTIQKLKFSFKFTEYPSTFTSELTDTLDSFIPNESEYFCQGVKLLCLTDIKYYKKNYADNKSIRELYKEIHIFAITECCALVFVNSKEEVYMSYIDDETITQHHKFKSINHFLMDACLDKMDDVSNPLMFNLSRS